MLIIIELYHTFLIYYTFSERQEAMKPEKIIYLVTHGEKTNDPNPGMTDKGKEQVRRLLPKIQKLMPEGPAEIHCGTGKRQKEVVECLGFSFADAEISDVWGGPSTLTKTSGEKAILLADGTLVQWGNYKTSEHIGGDVIQTAIRNLPHNSVICSGRPVLVRLGLRPEDCQNGALYALHVMEDNSIQIELLVSGVNLSDGGANV